MDEHTALQSSSSPLPPEQQLGAVGRSLVTGAEYVCKGMDYGARKASQLIEYVGEREKQKTQPGRAGRKGDYLDYLIDYCLKTPVSLT